jgi:flavin-dependent dehydrogenase
VSIDADVLVVGAGPAGCAVAIKLARAGWQVALAEQHAFPRRKVCGECIAAGNLLLLDELGVGPEFHDMAGPEIRRFGWMRAGTTVVADAPACDAGPYRYGRALGRERLDALLLERARAVGVDVRQPAKVHAVRADSGLHECAIRSLDSGVERTLRVRMVVDAHGSWESSAGWLPAACDAGVKAARHDSDLFAFKANFRNTRLHAGYLPVIAFDGGYGGMVVADGGRTTLAACIRRDALRAGRKLEPGSSAGVAMQALLQRSCRGVREALDGAQIDGGWISVGPLQPGIRIGRHDGRFRVGNAAGEVHPLIGEGISMALQSAVLLAGALGRRPASQWEPAALAGIQREYANAWRAAFAPRLRLAAVFAHIAMRPALSWATGALLQRWPPLLEEAARWSSKSRAAVVRLSMTPELV